jgi:MOSC domain-containing protein YiiM
MIATRRTGWYLRVLASEADAAATITVGAELVLEARPYPQWTVARALEVFYACKASGPTADSAALAACPALSPKWRARLTRDG